VPRLFLYVYGFVDISDTFQPFVYCFRRAVGKVEAYFVAGVSVVVKLVSGDEDNLFLNTFLYEVVCVHTLQPAVYEHTAGWI